MDKATLLLEAADILNSNLKVKSLLENILNITLRYMNAAAASVFLINDRLKRLELYLMAGEENPKIWGSQLSLGQGIAGWVAENGEAVISDDARSDPRFYAGFEDMAAFKTGALLCVPIRRREKILGVVEALNPQGGAKFSQDDLETLMALSGEMANSLENAMLIEKFEKNSREKELLFEISKKLNTFLELDSILDTILDGLSEVIEYDMAAIFLVDPITGLINPEVEKSKTRGSDEFYPENFLIKLGDGLVGWVAKNGQSVLVPDVTADQRYIEFRSKTASEMVVPIKSNKGVVGVLNIEGDEANKYSDEDLKLLEIFAGHAAVAIERAQLLDELLSKRKLEEELKIARRIQLTFLPSKQPEIAGYDIWAINRSYDEVGGDYYDFIPIVENQYGIAVGDVAGKGIPAAIIMAAFRSSLKAEIRNNFAIRTILYKVNNLLFESIEPGNYVTAVYGVLDSQNSIFTFSNAGHNPPIFIRADGRYEELSIGGMALGIIPDCQYIEKPIYLSLGDIIVFYTDGVTETFNSSEEEYGVERLIRIVMGSSGCSANEISSKILGDLEVFRNGISQTDDYTLIIMKKL